jgi:hypothetical protein
MLVRQRAYVEMTVMVLVVLAGGCATLRPTELAGFTRSPYFEEQVKTYTFEPEVTVHINAPAASAFDSSKPVQLVIFALPNGNTIAQTIGCQKAADRDWHFYIQHIGAQTRRLREVLTDRNLVVAYVEAGGKSWPAWRGKHEDSSPRIAALVDSIREHFPADTTTVALTAHSGGGGMLFGFINQVEQIPDWIERIVFLDANYSYSEKDRHAEKLEAWLQRSPRHYFGVVAYDDREIEVDGKKVVGPNGGTYRRTQEMIARFGRDLPLEEKTSGAHGSWRGCNGRLDIELFENPENKILHTVLVEKNGFIHALTFGTPHEGHAGELFGPPAYEQWIQPEPAAL